jgi:hypothetical protein
MLTINTARAFELFKAPSRYKGAWGGRGSGEHCLLNPGAKVVCIP